MGELEAWEAGVVIVGSHKKPPATKTRYPLDSGTGGCYAFPGGNWRLAALGAESKLESSLIVFSF